MAAGKKNYVVSGMSRMNATPSPPALPPSSRWQPCPESTYCPTGASNTTVCPAGFYCPVETDQPTVCPRGYYCPLASSEPIACVLGTYCPGGAEIFTSCPLGWYGSLASNNTLWSRDEACAEVRERKEYKNRGTDGRTKERQRLPE